MTFFGITDNPVLLVIAAHPDDEVLGCGGTMARLASEGVPVHCLIVAEGITSRVGLSLEQKNSELQELRNQSKNAHSLLKLTSSEYFEFPDNKMDSVPLLDIVQKIESIINKVKPTHILTHHKSDVNIDHQKVHESVIAATRPQPGSTIKQVSFFEILSSSEWRFSGNSTRFAPNQFVDISNFINLKIQALKCYDSEMREYPHPRSYETAEILSQWRGSIVGLRNAEAFELGRQID